ncbi:MAG: hypothetical protein DRH79_03705 [Candidatus Cloacimonadota bacterium]|nr:MAG: hypothetical protein DRH79_03705 [Candidatus Cloacimonadota bacterium]
MKDKHKKFIPLFVLLGIGIAFLLGWVIQLLWNATITPIFGSNAISYWQGVMLLVLFKILFSSHYNVHKEHHKKFHHTQPEFIRRHLHDEDEKTENKSE